MRRAKDIMIKRVNSVKPSDSVNTVCKVLTGSKISGVPVISTDNKLVGFVSEKDIITLLSRSSSSQKKVSDIMTKKVISVDENASLDLISGLFGEKAFRRIPVTSKGKLVGILNRSDVMDKLLGEHY